MEGRSKWNVEFVQLYCWVCNIGRKAALFVQYLEFASLRGEKGGGGGGGVQI